MEEYNVETQKVFLYYLLSDIDLWTRSNAIVKPEYFHKSLQKIVKYMKDHTQKFNGVPTLDQIHAATGAKLKKLDSITDSEKDWFLQNVEQFCRHRALEEWLITGMDLVQKGKYGQLEQGLKNSLLISLYSHLGTKYFEDPKERLIRMRNNNGQISSGWRDLDNKLYGGFNRGELIIFAAGPGGGKSLFLQNMALNKALDDKLTVVYITLELSEELISMRMDSMLTGFSTRELYKKLDTVHDTVKLKGKNAGRVQIKYMSPGTTTNDIKAYLKEFEVQEGVRPDLVLVDYLDLLHPNDRRINPSDQFIKDKYVSEELRAMANDMYPEQKMLVVTASQLNRTAVDEIDYNHANIAGGISKINTTDALIAIYTSRVMRERGRYQLQLLKTRNSNGVGEKIDLAFDVKCMRITDLDEEEDEEIDVLSQFKANKVTRTKSKVNDETEEQTVAVVKPAKSQNVLDLLQSMKK